jgi:CubicO group peptidase (beta-lactamase class C family)
MGDTGFRVPDEKLHRLSTSYGADSATGLLRVYDDAADSEWSSLPPFPSAGGGLVSTVDDYLAFSRMLLKGGVGEGGRLLREASVAEMTRDQLATEQRQANPFFFNAHTSWGLGMSVDISRGALYEHPGRFGWDGGLGTTARVDPANGIIGVLLTNRNMDSPEPPGVFTDFWTGLYRAALG